MLLIIGILYGCLSLIILVKKAFGCGKVNNTAKVHHLEVKMYEAGGKDACL
jgi:hypothetical protein